MKRKWLTTLVLMACAHMGAQAAGVTDAMIENDAKSTGDVLSWGMGMPWMGPSPRCCCKW